MSIAATDQKVRRILTSRYSTQSYLELMQEIFYGMKIVAPNQQRKEFSNFSSHIENYTHIGNYVSPKKENVAILAVCLKGERYVENSRSTQRSYAKKLIQNAGSDAAMIAFYTEGESRWRISFVRLDYEMRFENGKLKAQENLTPARRYSYLVGEGEPCHTAVDRFRRFINEGIPSELPTLADLEDAFSVEKVTNEFFALYCEKFHQLCDTLRANEDFMIEAEQHNYSVAQFAKKLMGQIVFLYFLQKKGWLGVKAWPDRLTEAEFKRAYYARGAKSRELIPQIYKLTDDGTYRVSAIVLNALNDQDEETLAYCVKGQPWGTGPKDFMRRLFKLAESKNVNFFEHYLEPLFYEALNENRGENGYCPKLHCRIPFLSGGLFEPIDGYAWRENNFAIPNEVFSNASKKGLQADGILDIFDRYNFTMSEDEPMEREVAIDPEMLGKVFENLLEIKDRKSKGAFYTPREIVHHMCQESLIAYLVRETGVSEMAVRDFILYGDFMKDEDTVKAKREGNGGMYISEELFLIDEHGAIIVDRLKDIDKALAEVRVADPAVGSGAFPLGMLNEIVRARQNITAYMAIPMSGYDKRYMYQTLRSPYTLKYETIKNCIFAADLDPSAVDIAQLRLWLSLVIDDEINPQAQNELEGHRNPSPLPNLECNILCGNSLIDEFEGYPLINQSKILGTAADQQQVNMLTGIFEQLLPELMQTQDELFRCKNANDKKRLKERLTDLRDALIMGQLQGASAETMSMYEISKQKASKPYVLWQLDFARVFREKGGFDIVIGNPPYGLLNKKQNQNTSIEATPREVEYYKTNPVYKPAKGGMINIFRLFICKSHAIMKRGGNMSLIFPMAFMCDLSAYELRKFLFAEESIQYIEAFPERDNENKRVFKSAKMSVCILGSCKVRSSQDSPFKLRINDDRYVNTSYPQVLIAPAQIAMIDKKSLTIPLISTPELQILLQMCNGAKRMVDFSKCYTGEIDLSLDKKYVRLDASYHRMLRGAQVQKYYTTDNISQGDILYLDSEKYLQEVHSPRSMHHKQKRIVMQGITGVNERYRLKMTLTQEGVFCANSVNYLLPEKHIEVILAILNSRLLNWFFRKLSTNSNVNGYEVDNLPISLPESADTMHQLENLVNRLLKMDEDATKADNAISSEIDHLVYSIYGLDKNQVALIESTY